MGDLARLRDQSGADEPAASSAPADGPKAETPRKTQTPNLYCLKQSHDPRMLTENRFFYWDLARPGCPVCPVCGQEVEAQNLEFNAKGLPTIPRNLLALQERIGERV